jgi:mannosyl-3-phosphoglycerate phosphatase
VIFSDIDGSLLDEKYESAGIESILKRLLSLNVSIVLTSSKTESEIEFYRQKWQISDPFIAENGSIIIIPAQYFRSLSKHTKSQNVIELGISYTTIREKLSIVKKQTRAEIISFGDMTVGEIAQDSSLPLNLAALAKKRKYSEPFKILNGEKTKVFKAILDNDLFVIKGGRYLTAMGNTDKGKAVSVLKNLFLEQFGTIFTIGVGDSDNDLTMLATVDKAFYIPTPAMIKPIWQELLGTVETMTV